MAVDICNEKENNHTYNDVLKGTRVIKNNSFVHHIDIDDKGD